MVDLVVNPKDQNSKLIAWECLKQQERTYLMRIDSTKKRSIDWNAYYFGVVIRYISDETGEDGLVIHDFLGFKFLRLTKNTRRSTASLNNSEFKTYCLQCRVWAFEVLKIFIPLPNEVIL